MQAPAVHPVLAPASVLVPVLVLLAPAVSAERAPAREVRHLLEKLLARNVQPPGAVADARSIPRRRKAR
jgi:hypothetical protein